MHREGVAYSGDEFFDSKRGSFLRNAKKKGKKK